jgi:hypothetical protein
MENYSCNENLLQSADENLPVLAPWPGCGRTVTSANVSKANQRSFKTESVMLEPLQGLRATRGLQHLSNSCQKCSGEALFASTLSRSEGCSHTVSAADTIRYIASGKQGGGELQ